MPTKKAPTKKCPAPLPLSQALLKVYARQIQYGMERISKKFSSNDVGLLIMINEQKDRVGFHGFHRSTGLLLSREQTEDEKVPACLREDAAADLEFLLARPRGKKALIMVSHESHRVLLRKWV